MLALVQKEEKPRKQPPDGAKRSDQGRREGRIQHCYRLLKRRGSCPPNPQRHLVKLATQHPAAPAKCHSRDPEGQVQVPMIRGGEGKKKVITWYFGYLCLYIEDIWLGVGGRERRGGVLSLQNYYPFLLCLAHTGNTNTKQTVPFFRWHTFLFSFRYR